MRIQLFQLDFRASNCPEADYIHITSLGIPSASADDIPLIIQAIN